MNAGDLRAQREHAALLRDLEALCAKYACTLIPYEIIGPASFPWVIYHDEPAHTIPDDPDAAGIIYIAGPMTGYPEWNHPAFFAMAEKLRAAGHTVICPAELHEPSPDTPWDWYLRRDIAELVKCARVVFLDGWTGSRGAILEHRVALGLGLELIYPHDIDMFIDASDNRPRRGCGDTCCGGGGNAGHEWNCHILKTWATR